MGWNQDAIESYSLKRITGPTVWIAGVADLKIGGTGGARIPTADTDEDFMILEWIKAATELCEDYSNRIFCSQTWELRLGQFPGVYSGVTWAGPGLSTASNGIRLPKGPWQSITSLKYYATDGTLTTLASDQYLFDDATGWLTPIYGGIWPIAQYRIFAVQVRFLAGYGATAAAVPFVLKNAVLMTVQDWLENRNGRFELPNGVKEKLESVNPGTMIL